MEVVNVPITEIKPYDNNPRDNSKGIEQVAKSISEHMSILHGDVYSCGYTGKTKSVKAKKSGANFKHKIKPFKLGVFVKDRAAIDRKMQEILTRNAVRMPDKMMIKVRGSESGGVEGEDKTVQ